MSSGVRLKILLGISAVFIATGLSFYHSSPTGAETTLNYNICLDNQQVDVDIEEVNAVVQSLNEPGDDLNKLMLRSNCYIKIENYELALKDMDKTISLNPKFGLAYHTRAKIYFLTNEYDKAVADLNHSIEHHLGDVDDYLLLAKIYITLKQLNDAEKVIKDALAASQDRGELYKSGSSTMVTIAYDEVLLYLSLSEILQQQNKTEESVDVLIEAADRSNGSVELFNALLALLELNNDQELIKKYKEERCHIPNIKTSKYCKV